MAPPSILTRRIRAASSVDQIARDLREVALQLEPGECLGSEATLTEHFQVSAPTLRQAARLLEHEELLEVRRGVQGGYFVTHPRVDTVSRVAATYLHSNPQSLRDVEVVLETVWPTLVQLIIASPRLRELEPFARSDARSREEFLEDERRFIRTLPEIAGNAALDLVFAIFFHYGSSVQHRAIPFDRPFLEAQRQRMDFVLALLAKDAAAATTHALERNRRICAGMKLLLDARIGQAGSAE